MATIQKTGEHTCVFLNSIDNTLDDNEKLRNINPPYQTNAPCYGLGAFDRLPLEIVHMTLVRLDMQSLTDFRRVNRRAGLLTDSNTQYKLTHKHLCSNIDSRVPEFRNCAVDFLPGPLREAVDRRVRQLR
ncbi:hypothetical protein BJY00DRAFT_318527 [Aspergillus carlsbadensis]|nr:hypothetical protein BJY00DRAFT_318527 [Aspergillus carlsbadensis]